MVSKAAFLYLSSLSWGCLALLPVVRLREVGRGFYRFFGFLCVGLDTLALVPALLGGPEFSGDFGRAAWALGASLFLTLGFTAALRARARRLFRACYASAAISGLAALAYFPWRGGPHPLFLGLHALGSSLLMGSGILAMMLGHWYLVAPRLSITPLKRYSAGYILLTVLTALELSANWMLYAGGGGRTATPEGLELLHDLLPFVLFRVAWGILAPLGLAYWIRETVRLKSTQSATGILYAAVVCTIVGEGMGLYLTLQTGVPF